MTLFAGVAETAAKALSVRSIRHRSALQALCQETPVPGGLVAAVFATLEHNWRTAKATGMSSPSRQNWRWCEPQVSLAERNTSPEVRLERAIALSANGWANQIPVCSGVAGSAADRRRAIDLVFKAGAGHFEFIELKIASDTPLYAAVEIIGYGCAWLLARRDCSLASSELLAANRVDLVVLAPAAYYSGFRLEALAEVLAEEVSELGIAHGVELGFGFDVLPAALATKDLPGGEDLATLIGQRNPL
jgi:hypothetical protein